MNFEHQIMEDPIRNEETDSQIQETALDAPRARLAVTVFARVQQPGRVQTAHKRVQFFWRQRGKELFLRAPSDNVERSFAVELLGNEVRLLREAVKSLPDRVLNDEDHALRRYLLAGSQITAKSRKT